MVFPYDCITLIANISTSSIAWHIVFYIIGIFLCAIGVALIFHTYIASELTAL